MKFDKTINRPGVTRHIYEPVTFHVEVVEEDDYQDADVEVRVMFGEHVVFKDEHYFWDEQSRKNFDRDYQAKVTLWTFARKLSELATIKWPS